MYDVYKLELKMDRHYEPTQWLDAWRNRSFVWSAFFLDLVFKRRPLHRQHFQANTIQVSTLLSIKTGKNVLKTVGTVLSQHVMTQNLKPKSELL